MSESSRRPSKDGWSVDHFGLDVVDHLEKPCGNHDMRPQSLRPGRKKIEIYIQEDVFLYSSKGPFKFLSF